MGHYPTRSIRCPRGPMSQVRRTAKFHAPRLGVVVDFVRICGKVCSLCEELNPQSRSHRTEHSNLYLTIIRSLGRIILPLVGFPPTGSLCNNGPRDTGRGIVLRFPFASPKRPSDGFYLKLYVLLITSGKLGSISLVKSFSVLLTPVGSEHASKLGVVVNYMRICGKVCSVCEELNPQSRSHRTEHSNLHLTIIRSLGRVILPLVGFSPPSCNGVPAPP